MRICACFACYKGCYMQQTSQNKMATASPCKLIWQMGLPMIVSMILQAVYNIVDTAFVINMGANGIAGNLALTYAFPVQLLIIAIGVGTGVGLNALLSKSLGEGNRAKANKAVGNGIFSALCIYAVFLLFGLFGAHAFIAMQAGDDILVVQMGTRYLTICCCCSFGAIGFTVYERFLQSTGKTLYSTIAQISGAAANIVLDYVFIFPLGMGIAGAAWATVIGQVISLVVAMLFHYCANRELGNSFKDIVPNFGIIKEIYRIGLSAALMQGMLSVMMLGVNLILATVNQHAELVQGSFGVYYKIMQFALFACFGLSNTIISVASFNYGTGNLPRARQCVKWGEINTIVVSAAITVLFEVFARPLASLFGMASGVNGVEITQTVAAAIRIASIGYVFMGVSIATQGVLQALGYALYPLLISCLRLAVFVFPAVGLLSLLPDAATAVWWAFPIAEALTAAVSVAILVGVVRRRLSTSRLPQGKCAANKRVSG